MNPAAATRLGAAALELDAGAAPPPVLLGDVDPLPLLLEAVALVERDYRDLLTIGHRILRSKRLKLTVDVIVAPELSVVVMGTGTVPLLVPFPPVVVPFKPPAPPATVELLPAPVVELLPVGIAPAPVTVEVEFEVEPVATTTVAVPDVVAVTVVDEVVPDDAAARASGKQSQRHQQNKESGDEHTLAVIGTISEDSVGVSS